MPFIYLFILIYLVKIRRKEIITVKCWETQITSPLAPIFVATPSLDHPPKHVEQSGFILFWSQNLQTANWILMLGIYFQNRKKENKTKHTKVSFVGGNTISFFSNWIIYWHRRKF